MAASSRSAMIPVLLAAIGWGIAGVLSVLGYSQAEWQSTVGLLMVFQAFCGFLAWRRLRLCRRAVLPDFLTIYLLMQFISKTVTAFGLIVRANSEAMGVIGDYLASHESVPLEYQFRAEVVFLLATMAFTVVWFGLERGRLRAVWHEPRSSAVWWMYGLSTAAYLGVLATGLGSALGMTQSLLRLLAIGAVAVLLGGRGSFALGTRRSWLALCGLVPYLVLALQSGMKSEVVVVLLPVLLPIFRRMTVARFAFVGAFVVFVLLFIFPFAQEWRMANWDSWQGREGAGIPVVASRVWERWMTDGPLDVANQSLAAWASRGSSSEQGGLVMQLAERDGLLGPVLIEGLATIFIPRFLWPDKPLYTPGAWFTWYLGKASSPEAATTATATMLPTELYWMFGVPGVLIGMGLLAALHFIVWVYLLKLSTVGLVPMFALFALLARPAGMEEIHAVYAFSFPVILVVYVVAIDLLQRLAAPWISPRVSVKSGQP